MKNNVSLFPERHDDKSDFERIGCDRCGQPSEAYYTLSHLTKGLWVRCNNCGKHARSFVPGYNLPWIPSKAFISVVGTEEARKQVIEAERTHGQSQISIFKKLESETKRLVTIPDTKYYCDAGTANNGQKGNQKTIVVIANEKGGVVFEKQIGDYSNNEGEILGIIASIREFAKDKPVSVLSDSNVAVNWANRGWTTLNEKNYKKGKLTERHKKYIQMANELLVKTKSVVSWIPREENLAGHYIEEKYKL
jgi:ribonuclease HI